jgi:hypothetical protein
MLKYKILNEIWFFKQNAPSFTPSFLKYAKNLFGLEGGTDRKYEEH